MHYYSFNIGDYARRTKHLDLMEDLAYRRLLDIYYLDEKPFTGKDPCDLARDIGMKNHVDEVSYVLKKFFPDGVNKAADEVIKDYRKKKKQQSEAGKASAKARKEKASKQMSNDCSTGVQPTNNQEPITKNQEPDQDTGAKAPKFNFKKELLAMGVDESVASDWLTVRRKKKASNTKTALTAIVKQINLSGLTANDAIKHSVENSWSGFKASWLKQNDGFSKTTQRNIENTNGWENE